VNLHAPAAALLNKRRLEREILDVKNFMENYRKRTLFLFHFEYMNHFQIHLTTLKKGVWLVKDCQSLMQGRSGLAHIIENGNRKLYIRIKENQ
jgi:hypothetical protein